MNEVDLGVIGENVVASMKDHAEYKDPQKNPLVAEFARQSDYELGKQHFAYWAIDRLRFELEHCRHEKWCDLSEIHIDWMNTLPEARRLVRICSRDHLKSTIHSVLYPLWLMKYYDGVRCTDISDTLKQGKDTIERVKDIVRKHPYERYLYPPMSDVDRTWSKTQIKLTNGSKLRVRGMGTPIRGPHEHLIVCDDILGDTQRFSDSFVKSYFKKVISPMILPDGQLIVVGTPQHANDIFSWLKKNTVYTTKEFPAIMDWDEKRVLWPERWTWDLLMEKRAEIGELAFTQEYMVIPIDDSSSLFPMDLITENYDSDHTLMADGEGWNVYIGIDPAMSASIKADYMVFFVIGLDENKNRWILEIIREKGLDLDEQIEIMEDLNERFRPRMMVCEKNAYDLVIRHASKITDLPLKPHHTSKVKSDLVEGVPRIRLMFENNKYRIPRATERDRRITDIYIHELNHFGWKDGKVKGLGEHDDTVMANYMVEIAIEGIAKMFRMVVRK